MAACTDTPIWQLSTAQGARVLAGHARRVRAILGEPGVNHPPLWRDQFTRLAGTTSLPTWRDVPRRGPHNLLRLLMIGPQPCRHGLHGLSSPIEHQSTCIHSRPGSLITTRQRREHLRNRLIQSLRHTPPVQLHSPTNAVESRRRCSADTPTRQSPRQSPLRRPG